MCTHIVELLSTKQMLSDKEEELKVQKGTQQNIKQFTQ